MADSDSRRGMVKAVLASREPPELTPGAAQVSRDDCCEQHPEVAGQRREAVRAVGITAPPPAVRGPRCLRPWLHGPTKRMPTDA